MHNAQLLLSKIECIPVGEAPSPQKQGSLFEGAVSEAD